MSTRSPESKRPRARAPRADQPDAVMGTSNTKRITPLTNSELTQAFLAHEDQLNILQTQTAIVFKLPSDGTIGKALLASVQGWQRDHKPGQAHPQGSCNQAALTRTCQVSAADRLHSEQFSAFLGGGRGVSQPEITGGMGERDIARLCQDQCQENSRDPGPSPSSVWIPCQAR